MAITDRELRKQQEASALGTAGVSGASDPRGETVNIHSRQKDHFLLSGGSTTTNVAEKVFGYVKRASKLRNAHWAMTGALTSNTANYAKLSIYKRNSAGAAQTLLASWNCAVGAEGTTVTLAPNACTNTSTAADLSIAAGSVLTYEIIKYGAAGMTVGEMSVHVDLEEV